jgi:tRNA threonylcarbamoyladenosine biosynthesis protein TsaE
MLQVKGDVSSPTFAIVNEYLGERPLYHIDLFRLDKLSQALEIGIEEYMNGDRICFIEWPELVEPLLPPGTVRIRMEAKADESRDITITCNG